MFDKNLLKLPKMRAVMMALVVLALLQSASIVGQAWGLSAALCALWEGRGVQVAAPFIVLFAACFAVLQLVRFGQETMLDRYSLEQAQVLRRRIVACTFDASCLLSVRAGTARVVQVANDGIDEVQTYVRIIPPKIIGMAAISAPLLICAFAFDWVSGVILAIMFPVIMFFMVLIGRIARERSERQYAAYSRLTSRFMDTLRGLGVIRAFGALKIEDECVHANSEGVRTATLRTLRTATLSSAVLDFIATFGVAAVAIMLAFRLMDGSMALFTGLMVLILAPEYFTPVRAFASDYHASLDGKNALAAVLELLDECDEGRAACPEPASLKVGDTFALRFEGVGHRYADGTVGVQDVSFTAASGQKVGVIGRSGAGKSTLAGVVAGLLPVTSGRVLLDGRPIDLASPEWKRLVRFVPQSPAVFRMTLDENIRFYCPQATREQVEHVVRAVGLEPLVHELPQGLDTLVGEGARGLSGGEAHRVALARILLDEQARVLVFDEPTSHLDIETERDLKQPMLDAMRGKLVVFATHRLHWTHDMDQVVELAGASSAPAPSGEEGGNEA